MILMVVDGQGGGMGATVIKRLRNTIGHELEILAFGTNSISTSRMLKSGANKGATGENAIVHTSHNADVIIGPLAIIMAHSMTGEITPKIAEAISTSKARKILIPLTQENVRVIGVCSEPLPHLVDQAVELIKDIYGR